MNKPTHLPAVVPASGGALTTTTGTQRIATRMADDLLNVARSRERVHASQRRYRIGEYEFKEADYQQIQRWARMLGMEPEAVVRGLEKCEKKHSYVDNPKINFCVREGHIVSLAWDFDTFPLDDWVWVGGLKIEQMGILNLKNGRIPTLPRCLRELFCDWCHLCSLDLTTVPWLTTLFCPYNGLIDLDLTPVPGLTTLNCAYNGLTYLDLTSVPGLTTLYCTNNYLTELDLTPVPRLTELWCDGNLLTTLDLTPVPWLYELDCSDNQLTTLDLTPVPGLTTLCCGLRKFSTLELDCSCNDFLTDLDLTPVQGLIWLQCDAKVRITNAPQKLNVNRV